MNKLERKLNRLLNSIEKDAAEANRLLVPVSGGSDSALVFWACHNALPRKTVGVHVGLKVRCTRWFESIGTVDCVLADAKRARDEEVRWADFLTRSLRLKGWLVGSRNQTEDLLGTYSLASRVATYLPLVNTWKTDVMDLCRFVGVPEEILASSLKADPDCGRPSELVAIPYRRIDAFLRSTLDQKTSKADKYELGFLSRPDSDYLYDLMRRNEFKKTLPIRGPRL